MANLTYIDENTDIEALLAPYTATVMLPEFAFTKNGTYTECNCLQVLADSYIISICKEDRGWIVFGEEHEPAEIAKIYEVPELFKTKKAALSVASELALDMYDSVFSNLYGND